MTLQTCRRTVFRIWFGTIGLFGLMACVSTGFAAPAAKSGNGSVDFMPVGKVAAGMKGYGLTVFAGTKVEKFPVEVIGVLRRFMPYKDVILIRSDDPRLLHTGIAAGMSGSPIYLEGKLAGALAYGWQFGKDPVAGITPIEYMLAESAAESSVRPANYVAANRASDDTNHGGWVEVGLPLTISGVTGSALREFEDALKPYGIATVQAGGGARDGFNTTMPYEPGGMVAMQLIRGDISASASGTVTYVNGNRVLAFGHPMFNLGEVEVPMANAEVHTILASNASSFKLASPLGEQGAMIADRQTCVIGEAKKSAAVVPVQVTARAPHAAGHTLHVEVVRHRFLTPVLIGNVISSAVQHLAPDVKDATVVLASKVKFVGFEPLTFREEVFSPEGLSGRILSNAGALRAVNDLLFNPFSPVDVEQIEIEAEVTYKAEVAEIVAISVSAEEVEPNSRINLSLTLRRYGSGETQLTVPLDIPARLAGQTIKVAVASSSQVRPELAPPENLNQLVANIRKNYPPRALVVGIETPEEGVAVHGRLLPRLPESVIDTLRASTTTKKAEPWKQSIRNVITTPILVVGRQEILIRVRDLKSSTKP